MRRSSLGLARLQKQLKGNNKRSRFTKEFGLEEKPGMKKFVPGTLVSYQPGEFHMHKGQHVPVKKVGLIVAAVLYMKNEKKVGKLALLLTEDRLYEIDVARWYREYAMRALTKPLTVEGEQEPDRWTAAGVTKATP